MTTNLIFLNHREMHLPNNSTDRIFYSGLPLWIITNLLPCPLLFDSWIDKRDLTGEAVFIFELNYKILRTNNNRIIAFKTQNSPQAYFARFRCYKIKLLLPRQYPRSTSLFGSTLNILNVYIIVSGNALLSAWSHWSNVWFNILCSCVKRDWILNA